MGLDRPIVLQYLYWLGNVLTGDFGQSISTRQAVLPPIPLRFVQVAEIYVKVRSCNTGSALSAD